MIRLAKRDYPLYNDIVYNNKKNAQKDKENLFRLVSEDCKCNVDMVETIIMFFEIFLTNKCVDINNNKLDQLRIPFIGDLHFVKRFHNKMTNTRDVKMVKNNYIKDKYKKIKKL